MTVTSPGVVGAPPDVGRRGSPMRVGAVAAAVVAVVAAVAAAAWQRRAGPPLYGVVVDAGSTGTRAHVGVFRRRGPGAPLSLVKVEFLEEKRGLAAHFGETGEVASVMDRLLERTRAVVPETARASTPVFVRATAGMRLAGEEAAEKILDAVRDAVQGTEFTFRREWVTIMDGQDEGLHGWVSINLLLGVLDSKRTVGTLDLGGGSVQMTFEVPDHMTSSRGVHAVPVGRDSRPVYSASHLGYGLLDFQRRLYERLEAEAGLASNPCVNAGEQVTLGIGLSQTQTKTTGKGDFDECVALVRRLVAEDLQCPDSRNCRLHSTELPKPAGTFIAFAYFYDRTRGIGMEEYATLDDLADKAREVCSLTFPDLRRTYPTVPNGQNELLCTDLAYIFVLLRDLLGLNHPDVTLRFTQHVDDYLLGWAIGTLLSEIEKLT
mmetsp:Transcript_19746/g.48573  ORF Transcript_19746/g.48573 Transcript_19746/m.48573 type:complete len:434 (+) Transcript_19746:53-1354(+)